MTYTTIMVPAELRDKIKELSMREGKAQWKIVEEAIGLYYGQKKSPRLKESLSIIDKVSWYIIKVCMSAGALKENPTEENLTKLQKTVEQIAQRLKWVPFSTAAVLLRTAQIYVKTDQEGRKRAAGELNMALKMLVVDILSVPEDLSFLTEEE